MDVGAFFPRLTGRRPLQMRDESRPAPRIEALMGAAGQAGKPDVDRTATAAMQEADYTEQERRAMRLQIANEVLMEARDAALKADLEDDVADEDAPEPGDIHETLPEWAVGLSRTVTLPAVDAEEPLADLAPTQRANLLLVGEQLTERFG